MVGNHLQTDRINTPGLPQLPGMVLDARLGLGKPAFTTLGQEMHVQVEVCFIIFPTDPVVHGTASQLIGPFAFVSGAYEDQLEAGDDLTQNLLLEIVKGVRLALEILLILEAVKSVSLQAVPAMIDEV